MAGDWIKLRSNITNDPRILRIAVALKIAPFSAIGACAAFWCAATEHSIDGRLSGWTDAVVDAMVGLPGLAAALRAVDWLATIDDGLLIPRWEEHNSASAKERALNRERARRSRATVGPQQGRDGSVTAPLQDRDESVTALLPNPHTTVAPSHSLSVSFCVCVFFSFFVFLLRLLFFSERA